MSPRLSIALLAGCGEGGSPSGPGSGGAGDTEVDNYINALQFDSAALLNVQETGSGDREETQIGDPETTVEWVEGVGEKSCTRTTYNLKQNFDKLAILRPTQGIVWPGALVKGNASLTDGLPEPLTLGRAPVTLSLDLPGM